MKMTLTKLALWVVVAFIGIYGCTSRPDKETLSERPNIILIMGDDHGYAETGYNGHPFIKTPVLDEMAGSGLVLNRFYSAHPSCSPTRGSVITGRHPNRYGTFSPGWSIRPEEISVAQLLKSAGYATGHFGKWHLGPVKAESPTNPGAMGFDTWLSHDNFFELDPVLSRNGGPPEKYAGEGSEVIVDETISFIKKNKDTPLMAVVWFASPHEPYQSLPEDLALYEDLPDSLSRKTFRLTSLKTGMPVTRPQDSVLQERYAEITAMDRAIGKLRTYLKNENLKDNTLIWYCGDNGIPASGNQYSSLREGKGTVYEGGSRVPGIIEWPSMIGKHEVSEVNAVTSDMLPTLCELAGVSLPDRPLDGTSLKPLLSGEVQERDKPICFWMFDQSHLVNDKPYVDEELQQGTTPLAKIMDGSFTRSFSNYHHKEITADDYKGDRAILDGAFKLVIVEQNGSLKKELFNVNADPYESKDLSANYPEVVDRLEKQMKLWQNSVLNSLVENDYKRSGL